MAGGEGSIAGAVAGLGEGALTEEGLREHVFPLFSGTMKADAIYLANHSLGRPLDCAGDDLLEAVTVWRDSPATAWDGWLAEQARFRASIATLIGAERADCVVPKASAAQGLRAVLNSFRGVPRVVATSGEFESVDVVLRQYVSMGRAEVMWVGPDEDGWFGVERVASRCVDGVDLVVVSQVMFMTGQLVAGLERLAEHCHSVGARLLVDGYHSVGALPVDVAAMGADYLIGGCYKYLRGAPGAGFLYISPRILETGAASLDIGWFAKDPATLWERPDPPRLAEGGNGWLEGAPAVFTYYQARSGLAFTLGMGMTRLRTYSLDLLGRLKGYLAGVGVDGVGADDGHGAFLTVRRRRAGEIASALAARGVQVNARGEFLRMTPDCLNTDEELRRAAALVGEVAGSLPD